MDIQEVGEKELAKNRQQQETTTGEEGKKYGGIEVDGKGDRTIEEMKGRRQ